MLSALTRRRRNKNKYGVVLRKFQGSTVVSLPEHDAMREATRPHVYNSLLYSQKVEHVIIIGLNCINTTDGPSQRAFTF